MTTATRIISHLERVGEATNYELSRDLDLPEASIRRTTLQMDQHGQLMNVADGVQLVWRLKTFPPKNAIECIEGEIL